MQKLVEKMTQMLYAFTDYYDTVAWDFLEEAVENTYKDTGMTLAKENLENYHSYISENYI